MRRYRTKKSVTEKSVSRVLWPLEAPPMCPRPTPGVGSTAYTRKKRVEWLARYRFRYLTNFTNSRVRSSHPFDTKSPFSRFFKGADAKKARTSRGAHVDGGDPKPQLCAFWGARSRVNTIINRVRSIPRATKTRPRRSSSKRPSRPKPKGNDTPGRGLVFLE